MMTTDVPAISRAGLLTSLFRVSRWPVLLAGICGLLFFHDVGERDLWGSHEARAAQNAQRMLDDSAWGLPRLFDDHYDFQKPPMFYWLAAVAGWTNSGHVDAFAVRLPAALAATACVFLVFLVMQRRKRPVAGLVAALVLRPGLPLRTLAASPFTKPL